MIRQVAGQVWVDIIQSKGSKQNQDNFLREFEAFRIDYARRKQALSAQYKGDLENPLYLSAKAALVGELNSTMLNYGFYEVLSDAELEDEKRDYLISEIKNQPLNSFVILLVAITNKFREDQGKPSLTEAQIKARLLA